MDKKRDETMKFFLASDHAGRAVKEKAKKIIDRLGIYYVDLSPKNTPTDDYPDFAKRIVPNVLSSKKNLGILVCKTGIGMSMAANRHKGIRAALCHTKRDAESSRKHNDANVLVLSGAYKYGNSLKSIISTFYSAKFQGGRHLRRIRKL